MNSQCPECGAPISENKSCENFFHQMLFWENEDPANGRVHHLMVLCYHLQHPSLYSHEGLEYGRELMKRFIVDGESPERIRQQMKKTVRSSNRSWNIKSGVDSRGAYETPIAWRMNAADVVAGGIENYCKNVEKWAGVVQKQLDLP